MSEHNSGNAEATPTTESGGTEGEKTYSASAVEQIVKDRLARDRAERKVQKQYEKQLTKPDKPSANANVEEDLRGRLSQFEEQSKALNDRLASYRTSQIKSTVEAECAKHGCNDPELLATHFLSKKLVSVDDED